MELKRALLGLVLAAPLALAHPHGVAEPQHNAKPLPRGLGHCSKSFEASNLSKRTAERHMAEVEQLKKERGLEHMRTIHRRQFGGGFGGGDPAFIEEILNTDHKTDKDVTADTDPLELFADAGSCVLSPEVTEGPLYVRGEQIRRELTSGELGVNLRFAVQVVDVNTCEPVPDAWVDLWSCNSTGVYGGVQDYPGNGDPNVPAIINSTALRGVQPTDKDGIALFDTLVPGHYAGRATHMHAMVHHDVTQQENGTITGGHVSHIGQMYFDQSLLQVVEQTPTYAINTQNWVQNANDALFTMGTSGGDDPIVRYAILGESVENGLFGWIRFGVDLTAQRTYNPAAYKDENGGHMNPGGPVGGGFPGGFPGGGFPGFGGGAAP
ncbi:related to protocatechuate 3,4-dioxygenase beta subunit [Cephalotrichum gorgonifer]|uniref:Related to protocatechuate 3,4-dioxygenase beta subunit n=1 Tax=Cephalotrichum gorgonifer TaxID=2041049 RepID=A0AAE8N760_9PEZI|nr:related to protocatechuate 3,4-dioxygenase beta subunit [Cephalotrichum gorgonifer]